MGKTIEEFLPDKSTENCVIQGRIPRRVFEEARKIMKRDRLNWSEVLTACLCAFCEEKGNKKK